MNNDLNNLNNLEYNSIRQNPEPVEQLYPVEQLEPVQPVQPVQPVAPVINKKKRIEKIGKMILFAFITFITVELIFEYIPLAAIEKITKSITDVGESTSIKDVDSSYSNRIFIYYTINIFIRYISNLFITFIVLLTSFKRKNIQKTDEIKYIVVTSAISVFISVFYIFSNNGIINNLITEYGEFSYYGSVETVTSRLKAIIGINTILGIITIVLSILLVLTLTKKYNKPE